MALVLVQTTGAALIGGGPFQDLAFPVAITQGNLLVVGVAVGTFDRVTVGVITDTRGNEWTRVAATNVLGPCAIFTARAKDSGACTVRLTLSSGAGFSGMGLAEVQGTSGFPCVTLATTDIGTGVEASAGILTPTTSAILLAILRLSSNDNMAPGAGWTQIAEESLWGRFNWMTQTVVAGNYTANWTPSPLAAQWYACAVGVTEEVTPSTTGQFSNFFGEDIGLGDASNTRIPFPNSIAAHDAFFTQLIAPGTIDFETGANPWVFGNGVSCNLVFGALTTKNPPGTIVGRYPTSGVKYWDVDAGLIVLFSAPVAAFGFYGVDVGDFTGRLTITLARATGPALRFVVPHTIGSDGNTGGGVIYFGFCSTAPTDQFTYLEYGNTAPGVDLFAFDDFTVGLLGQVIPSGIPLPAACPAPNPAATGGGTACPATLLGGGS